MSAAAPAGPGLAERFRARFGRAPEFVARAPGRIEFIGNHTDYNGGTVLGAAIDRGIWIAARASAAGTAKLASDHAKGTVTLGLAHLARLSRPPVALVARAMRVQ